MVEDGEGCYIELKRLGIAKVANPNVIYYGLNEDLYAVLSSLVCLIVLESSIPGSFCASAVNARSFCDDCRVVTGRTGGWSYKGSAVVVEIAIHAGNKAPQVVDAVDAVMGGLDKDWQDGV
jgi:hypothetical protein